MQDRVDSPSQSEQQPDPEIAKLYWAGRRSDAVGYCAEIQLAQNVQPEANGQDRPKRFIKEPGVAKPPAKDHQNRGAAKTPENPDGDRPLCARIE